jgi:hypothetical protein
VPHTIASDTAQNENWNIHFVSIVASKAHHRERRLWIAVAAQEEPVVADDLADAEREGEADGPVHEPGDRKLVRIFATTVPAFFAREKPISRKAKPACMKITSSAATITQIELIATLSGNAPLFAASACPRTPPLAAPQRRAPPQAAPRRSFCASVLLVGIHRPEWWFEEAKGSLSRVEDSRSGFLHPVEGAPRSNARAIFGHVDNDPG